MSIPTCLLRFVLYHFGGDALDGAGKKLIRRFSDPSRKLPAAISRANDHSWRVIELSLARDGLWTRLVRLPLASADERAFRREVQGFLERHPLAADSRESFRRSCLEELRAARNAGLLALRDEDDEGTGAAGPDEALARFGKPSGLVDDAWQAVGDIAGKLRAAGYIHLPAFIEEGSRSGLPLLVAAFSHFLRKEVEEDEELSRGLTFDQLQALGADLENEFAGLHRVFGSLGGQLTGLFDGLSSQVEDLHGAVHRIERGLRSALREARAESATAVAVRPETIAIDLGSGVALELALIEPGEFTLGSPPGEKGRCADEGPEARIRIPEPFYIGLTPITQGQWFHLMRENPANFKESPRHPVENVSWTDCQQFCTRLAERTGRACRLPGEAEWEYACRAGTVTVYSFGDDLAALGEHAWYSGNATSPQPVARKLPNGWGLHDVHGNVWEWCQDAWHDDYRGVPADGRAWTEGGDPEYRVLRGGSWGNGAHGLRSAARGRASRGLRRGIFGLRVVMARAPGAR
jgi:formylglycine-generating enzyme required for sulfatase activity